MSNVLLEVGFPNYILEGLEIKKGRDTHMLEHINCLVGRLVNQVTLGCCGRLCVKCTIRLGYASFLTPISFRATSSV